MPLVWNIWALPAIIAFALALATAAVVYATRPDRAQNRWLAVSIATLATGTFCVVGLRPMLIEKEHALVAVRLSILLLGLGMYVNLRFLATLNVPLSRPFARPAVHLPVLAAFAFIGALPFLVPDLVFPDATRVPRFETWGVSREPLFTFISIVGALNFVFAVVVGLSAYRRAMTPALKRQAKFYAMAAMARDVPIAVVMTFAWWLDIEKAMLLHFTLFPVGDLAFTLLLGYGILKSQLFDIDLRLKRGFVKTAVAGAIAGAFFVGSELLEKVVPVDDKVLGIAAAGGIVLALRPVENLARRGFDRLMPGVDGSESYLNDRKLEVYRVALEGAFLDGTITPREQDILVRLQSELGITPPEARAAEDEIRTRLSGVPAAQLGG